MQLLLTGVSITALSWIFAWGRFGILTEYSFFPLWTGYVLIVNGLGAVLCKVSLIGRMRSSFFRLFLLSIPMWWFFERINNIVQNWHYQMQPISNIHYFIQASIDFSTVIPAVLSTSVLFFFLLHAQTWANYGPIRIRSNYLVWSFLIGIISFSVLPVFPHQTFPLVWIAPILILEPFAYYIGTPCVLRLLADGRWAIPISTMLATFFCGFWWELWNYYSFPRWYYTIWYVGCCKIFEMPALGYLGYPFFGLIILSYTAFAHFAFFREDFFQLFSTGDYDHNPNKTDTRQDYTAPRFKSSKMLSK